MNEMYGLGPQNSADVDTTPIWLHGIREMLSLELLLLQFHTKEILSSVRVRSKGKEESNVHCCSF